MKFVTVHVNQKKTCMLWRHLANNMDLALPKLHTCSYMVVENKAFILITQNRCHKAVKRSTSMYSRWYPLNVNTIGRCFLQFIQIKPFLSIIYRALDRGRIGVFTHLKCQKRIGDDVGDLKYIFTNNIYFFGGWKWPANLQEYDSNALKCILLILP
jgi:hypothetical protein